MKVLKAIEDYKGVRFELGQGADEMAVTGAPNRDVFISAKSAGLRKREAELATWLHDNYEQIAKGANWDTQKSCKVSFEDLPDENKNVMLELAKRILES